jgi:hypothetical protein
VKYKRGPVNLTLQSRIAHSSSGHKHIHNQSLTVGTVVQVSFPVSCCSDFPDENKIAIKSQKLWYADSKQKDDDCDLHGGGTIHSTTSNTLQSRQKMDKNMQESEGDEKLFLNYDREVYKSSGASSNCPERIDC